MKERPILFNAEMVRAILDGRKTQTRRIAKFKPLKEGLNLGFSGLVPALYATGLPQSGWVLASQGWCWNDRTHPLHSPCGLPGDRMWVRETLAATRNAQGYVVGWHYAADGVKVPRMPDLDPMFSDAMAFAHLARPSAVPSIHMPRWASRITLEVTGVRVERLWRISEADAAAEGVESLRNEGELWKDYQRSTARSDELICLNARDSFATLWDSLAPTDAAWKANPWVWVAEFKRVAAEA